MDAYLEILERVIREGKRKKSRTGVDTLFIPTDTFEHHMEDGFPLLTTKEVRHEGVFSELEMFIKGITDKEWLRDRKNHIWDDWCNPERLKKYDFSGQGIEDTMNQVLQEYQKFSEERKPLKRVRRLVEEIEPFIDQDGNAYSIKDDSEVDKISDNTRKIAQYLETDLGPIYGFQWRHFGAEYRGPNEDYSGEGVDQLQSIVDKLKDNPVDRRMLCSAWNPNDLHKMALPPCHYNFKVTSDGKELNLTWDQRSTDVPLGLPFNIASYACLLHLLAKETGLQEGKLTGQLTDVHIYENQMEGVKEQLKREPLDLPRIKTENFDGIFNWNSSDTKVEGYEHHPKIYFPIAV